MLTRKVAEPLTRAKRHAQLLAQALDEALTAARDGELTVHERAELKLQVETMRKAGLGVAELLRRSLG